LPPPTLPPQALPLTPIKNGGRGWVRLTA
jgi:hypothetical protein